MHEKHGFTPGDQHPEEWRRDLNPDATAGINAFDYAPDHEAELPTAGNMPHAQDILDDLPIKDLDQLPVLPEGTRLQQGAVYIDLKDPKRKEFKAMGNMEAGPDNWYVPKDKVDYPIWNRLIGVENPERLGLADED